ncbi:MAG: sigma-70 family RNA polymerase sigma factor [Lachnospiraceae bacterium]|nr:sigma-70 family RNA polymerase sigma factor [Lachnospiraceae bacterium]
MEDNKIIELYFKRIESAITETSAKYGHFLHTISMNILQNHEDAEECVNDTYLRTWNSIPPARPQLLKAYLGAIIRNLSLDCYKRRFAGKRVSGEFSLLLSELEDCIPASSTPEKELENKEIAVQISNFLKNLPLEKRLIFLRRYYYCDDIKTLSARFGYSESKIKSTLFSIRKKLKIHLEKEEIYL